MTQPLALILYERLFPGGTLVNRMQDLGYRVQALNEPSALVAQAERDKPLLALIDLEPRPADACRAIADVRRHGTTSNRRVRTGQ